MGCLTELIELTFKLLQIIAALFIWKITFFFIIIKTIVDLIYNIIKNKHNKNNHQDKFQYSKNNKNKSKIIEEESYETLKEHNDKEISWHENEFEKEADFWGLSKEDRRLAKEEKMTPAEFIEAEEYDDDELLLDEWER